MVGMGSRILYWNISQKYQASLDKKVSELVEVVEGQKYVFIAVYTSDEVERELVRIIL
ncbi:ubiquitin-activating enzyme E1 [Ecytonucleospora hepatopenaei]|uniref:Ubiquitin-activating enzyme E1 n=1 Tax=Ecytonucleospora hepatopenaei TaxID=646526 RepID=A0A1W0E917_9MICR|nr:ubiquitin-activating enzyme E1 [Ecytonucleospora hepatopenaei]